MPPRPTILARDLVESPDFVDGATRIGDLLEWFKANPHRDYVAVVQAGEILGLAGRDELNRQMSGKYGFSLLADRPVREVLIAEVLVVPGDRVLEDIIRDLLRSGLSGRTFYQDIIIGEGDDFLGLASVKRLIIEQMQRITEQVEAIQAQSEILARKNGELAAAALRAEQSGGASAYFDLCSVPIVVLDAGGRVMRANRRFYAISGFLQGELDLGTQLVERHLFPDSLDRFRRALSTSAEPVQPQLVPVRRRDGSLIAVELSVESNPARGELIASVLRTSTMQELELQDQAVSRLGENPLARQIASRLYENRTSVDEMLTKLDRIAEYARRIGETDVRAPAEARSTDANRLTGSLGEFNILDLCQLLVQSAKTGELRIQAAPALDAAIYFSRGRIVHAIAAALEGAPALKEALKLKAGDFQFNYDVVASVQTIFDEPMSLLIECGREIDEEVFASLG